jgi:hypothetical protein
MRTATARLLILLAPLPLAEMARVQRTTIQAFASGARGAVRALAGATAPYLPTGTHRLTGAPLALDALRGRVVRLRFGTPLLATAP